MTELKNNYAVDSKHKAFYTGGKIQVSQDGVYMFCGCGDRINMVEVSTGKIHAVFGEKEEEEITSFCLSPDQQYLVIATQNLLLRQWNWSQQILIRTWKAIHVAPIVSMAFDSTSTLLATGSADSTIKIWDILKKYCTHNLRGHQGLVSVVEFHPDISRLQLFSSGEDYKVRVWNLTSSTCVAAVEAHYSIVTSIVFSPDGNTAFSSGRDSIIAVWDTETLKVTKTIPVFEIVESLILLPDGLDLSEIGVTTETLHVVTAGSKGVLRVWNTKTSKCVFSTVAAHGSEPVTEGKEGPSEDNILQMIFCPALEAIVTVTNAHNISIMNIKTFALQKQLSGNNDEILDLKLFGEESSQAIVISNSKHIKLFDLDTWDCSIIYGHTDIVLCADVFVAKNMFISGSKDNTVRVWKFDLEKKVTTCVAVGHGHTHAVGAVAMSRTHAAFFVSGSEDSTLKLWKLPVKMEETAVAELHAVHTEHAHDKNISALAVAPNDKFVVSGSMDKTIKLWSADTLALLGVMRGHKRGIWSVQFSPIDKAIASSSGDGTIKIWSLSDFSCVKTFEGHDCAVLRVTFIARGMQLLSSATDGLVKLWTIKSNECVKTFDEHESTAWALVARNDGDSVITGGADSNIIIWKDVTQTEVAEAREKQEKFILQEQELLNLLQQKKYLKAIGLAITLEQPFRVLGIIKEILAESQGAEELQTTLEKLRPDQMDAILRFAVKWNTNSKHCHESQYVMSVILKTFPTDVLSKFPNIKSSVEGLLPYTDRHLQRMNRLLQQAMFVEYTWQCMRNIATDGSLPSTSVTLEELPSTEDLPQESISVKSKEELKKEDSSSEDADSEEESEEEALMQKKQTKGKQSQTRESSHSKSAVRVKTESKVDKTDKSVVVKDSMSSSNKETGGTCSETDENKLKDDVISRKHKLNGKKDIVVPTSIKAKLKVSSPQLQSSSALKSQRKSGSPKRDAVDVGGGLSGKKSRKRQITQMTTDVPKKVHKTIYTAVPTSPDENSKGAINIPVSHNQVSPKQSKNNRMLRPRRMKQES